MDDNDPNIITKKFWSYAKASSANTRIPESVNLHNTHKSKHLEQAELFNQYFYNQFSDESKYDISIGNFDSEIFDIDFICSRINNSLKNYNPNKAMGPDKISGRILKQCAATISCPLQIKKL